MSRYVAQFGDENGFHVTVEKAAFNEGGFNITVWTGNSGMSPLPTIRQETKARAVASYLYETLLDEHEAERKRQSELFDRYMAEQAKKPKPTPPKIPKNAPKVDVLECGDCNALIPPDEVSDERVYECGECGTSSAGEDARRCDQCNKFTTKIADTSCPECGAAMDEAKTVQAQAATNGDLIKVEAAEAA